MLPHMNYFETSPIQENNINHGCFAVDDDRDQLLLEKYQNQYLQFNAQRHFQVDQVDVQYSKKIELIANPNHISTADSTYSTSNNEGLQICQSQSFLSSIEEPEDRLSERTRMLINTAIQNLCNILVLQKTKKNKEMLKKIASCFGERLVQFVYGLLENDQERVVKFCRNFTTKEQKRNSFKAIQEYLKSDVCLGLMVLLASSRFLNWVNNNDNPNQNYNNVNQNPQANNLQDNIPLFSFWLEKGRCGNKMKEDFYRMDFRKKIQNRIDKMLMNLLKSAPSESITMEEFKGLKSFLQMEWISNESVELKNQISEILADLREHLASQNRNQEIINRKYNKEISIEEIRISNKWLENLIKYTQSMEQKIEEGIEIEFLSQSTKKVKYNNQTIHQSDTTLSFTQEKGMQELQLLSSVSHSDNKMQMESPFEGTPDCPLEYSLQETASMNFEATNSNQVNFDEFWSSNVPDWLK